MLQYVNHPCKLAKIVCASLVKREPVGTQDSKNFMKSTQLH